MAAIHAAHPKFELIVTSEALYSHPRYVYVCVFVCEMVGNVL